MLHAPPLHNHQEAAPSRHIKQLKGPQQLTQNSLHRNKNMESMEASLWRVFVDSHAPFKATAPHQSL